MGVIEVPILAFGTSQIRLVPEEGKKTLLAGISIRVGLGSRARTLVGGRVPDLAVGAVVDDTLVVGGVEHF